MAPEENQHIDRYSGLRINNYSLTYKYFNDEQK